MYAVTRHWCGHWEMGWENPCERQPSALTLLGLNSRKTALRQKVAQDHFVTIFGRNAVKADSADALEAHLL